MNYPYQNSVAYQRQVRRREQQMFQTSPLYSAPKLEKLEISPEFMNSISAEVFKNHALGNMLTKNPLKYGMQLHDYGASLMRQGKIPEKDFCINNNTLIEINKRGERFKETNFIKESDEHPPMIECNYYNSYTQDKFKTIQYTKNGEQEIRYNINSNKE